MKLRNTFSLLALVALSLMGCDAKEEPKKLPVIDQAIEEYKHMADPSNPVHADLISAGYKPAGVQEEYVVVETQTTAIAATVWVKQSDPDKPLISVSEANRYVSLRYYGQAWRCDVPKDNTWGAEALTTAFKQLYNSGGRTVEHDGTKQTFVCGL